MRFFALKKLIKKKKFKFAGFKFRDFQVVAKLAKLIPREH